MSDYTIVKKVSKSRLTFHRSVWFPNRLFSPGPARIMCGLSPQTNMGKTLFSSLYNEPTLNIAVILEKILTNRQRPGDLFK